MDSDTIKMLADFAAKKIVLALGGALMTAGAFQTQSQETQFETMGAGLIVWGAGVAWSWWQDRGKQLVLARIAKAHSLVAPSVSTATAAKVVMASPPSATAPVTK